MRDIRTIGVKDLKNNLSAYLREVRRGTRILVSDRSTVVAELHEPGAVYTSSEAADPVLTAWLQDGVLIPPTHKKARLPRSPVRLAEGAALRLLDQERGETKP